MVTLEMKRFKKCLSGILAVMLMLVCFMPSANISVNATNELDYSSVPTGEEVDYFPYYDEHVSTPFGEKQLFLAEQGVLTAEMLQTGIDMLLTK